MADAAAPDFYPVRGYRVALSAGMLGHMHFTQLFAPTLREDPADAEVISHKLLLRAGYIRRVTSGVYDFLPLGLRVLRRIEQIVREEMNAAGAQEMLMPMVQPAELWQDSGRWDKYGRELLRFTDRHAHDSCLGPTHEEVVCTKEKGSGLVSRIAGLLPFSGVG